MVPRRRPSLPSRGQPAGAEVTRPFGARRRRAELCRSCWNHRCRSPLERRRSTPHTAWVTPARWWRRSWGPRGAEGGTETSLPGATGVRGGRQTRRCRRAGDRTTDEPGRHLVRRAARESTECARRGTSGGLNGVDARSRLGWVPCGTAVSPSASEGTPRRAGVRPDDTRTAATRRASRNGGRLRSDRPGTAGPDGGRGWGVTSRCRSLLVHCLPWQRRDRLATIPPLCGGVRPRPP